MCFPFSANTPWNRVRLTLGFGTGPTPTPVSMNAIPPLRSGWVRSPVPIRPSWLTLASNKCQLNDSRVVAVLTFSYHRSTSGRLLGASTERGRHLLPQSHNFRLDVGWIAKDGA